MRYALKSAALLFAAALAACAAPTIHIAAQSPEAQKISAALSAWPEAPSDSAGIKRPFFATIHIAGKRTTASGLLEFHNARDFRITAVTEMGVILFDARFNWAGVTLLRQMPGLPSGIVSSLVKDIGVAFDKPDSLASLGRKNNNLVVSIVEADTHRYTWTFDSTSGRVRQVDVDMGILDDLKIEYKAYNALGWPQELTISRPASLYNISFSFTDSHIAQNNRRGAQGTGATP